MVKHIEVDKSLEESMDKIEEDVKTATDSANKEVEDINANPEMYYCAACSSTNVEPKCKQCGKDL